MNTKKIGLFDSGMGGLSILQVLLKKNPDKDFVYFADTLNLPYGDKSKEEVHQHCIKVKDFLFSLDVDVLIITCNSASCLYIDEKHYKNIPLFNVISPTIKKLMEISSDNDKVGVLATSFTVQSNVYPEKIQSLNPRLRVFQEPAPDLAPLVERGFAQDPKCRESLKKHLGSLLKQDMDILVLGCTHYFFLKEQIRKMIPSHIKIVDLLDDFDLEEEANLKDKNSTNFKEKKCDSNVKIYMTQEQPEFIKTSHQITKDPQIKILKSF